jgi:chorismate mutase
MGDSGEGLIDADGRIQERMEELERERTRLQHGKPVRDPVKMQALESLRLARTELDRQLLATTNERRRTQITQAIAEINRRMEATENGVKV